MASPVSLCGVILSAGFSSRMGRDKALLPWPPGSLEPGKTLLAASIASLASVAETIFVVAGNNAAQLASVVKTNGAVLVENPAPERGQFSSLQIGLSALVERGFSATMITLVDSPPLCDASLALLRAAFARAVAEGKWAVAPEHNGKGGHPLFAARPMIDAFLAAPVTANAREIQHGHANLIRRISVPDAVLTVDINTPEQYVALARSPR